jgi:hypothetical protein
MTPSILWRLMFRVANRAAYEKCLTRTLPLLGVGCEADEGRPYWKVPELWECNVVCLLPGGSVAEQVLGCILAAQRLASGWYILGSLSAESAVGFSGVFSGGHNVSVSSVVGLEWASFDVVAARPA